MMGRNNVACSRLPVTTLYQDLVMASHARIQEITCSRRKKSCPNFTPEYCYVRFPFFWVRNKYTRGMVSVVYCCCTIKVLRIPRLVSRGDAGLLRSLGYRWWLNRGLVVVQKGYGLGVSMGVEPWHALHHRCISSHNNTSCCGNSMRVQLVAEPQDQGIRTEHWPVSALARMILVLTLVHNCTEENPRTISTWTQIGYKHLFLCFTRPRSLAQLDGPSAAFALLWRSL